MAVRRSTFLFMVLSFMAVPLLQERGACN
jgi:hypothetical protein